MDVVQCMSFHSYNDHNGRLSIHLISEQWTYSAPHAHRNKNWWLLDSRDIYRALDQWKPEAWSETHQMCAFRIKIPSLIEKRSKYLPQGCAEPRRNYWTWFRWWYFTLQQNWFTWGSPRHSAISTVPWGSPPREPNLLWPKVLAYGLPSLVIFGYRCIFITLKLRDSLFYWSSETNVPSPGRNNGTLHWQYRISRKSLFSRSSVLKNGILISEIQIKESQLQWNIS